MSDEKQSIKNPPCESNSTSESTSYFRINNMTSSLEVTAMSKPRRLVAAALMMAFTMTSLGVGLTASAQQRTAEDGPLAAARAGPAGNAAHKIG